jgi:photosystem II stability/assembly factor-like uncharacterized protein
MKAPFETDEQQTHATTRATRVPKVPNKARLRAREFLGSRGLPDRTAQLAGLALDRAAAGDGGDAAPPQAPRAADRRYLEATREAPPAPAAEEVTWRSLGPVGIPNGQTYGSGPGSRKTMSGRVAAFAVDPSDPRHLLLGAAGGGIWESRDEGDSWAVRTDDAATLSIGAIAFDPSDPGVVWAGTGEGNSEYAHLGQGLLRSTDGGTTWTQVAAPVFAGVGFYHLVVDPLDSDRLLVATTGGGAVSRDGGATWALLHRGTTWDLSLAPVGGRSELLVAAPDGLWAGADGGALTAVDLPGLALPLDANAHRMAVRHVPADPGQVFVFAADAGGAHLWHRADADGPYTELELVHGRVPPYIKDTLDTGQASYDWCLGLPPGTTDTVYLGAIELVRGRRSGGTWQWTDVSSRRSHGDSIHPDQHVLAFHPTDPQVVYAGNDGGAFRSDDAGTHWRSLNPGLVISEVEYLALRPDQPAWNLAGLQDNGTIRTSGSGTWTQVALGDGGDCAVSDSHPDSCYHSYYDMYLERSDHGGDPGTWHDVTPTGAENERSLFYPPVEAKGDLIIKAGENIHLSSDRGDTWRSVPVPQPGQVSVASAICAPTESRAVVATIRGQVLDVRPQGTGWSAGPLGQPRAGWVSDVVVGPDDRLWVTFSQVPGATTFRSDDGGTSWTDVSDGLPKISANSVVVDPRDGDRVWVACDVGVFQSRDAGATWQRFGTGLPNAIAADLVLEPGNRLLRAGTRSRGVWEAPIPD